MSYARENGGLPPLDWAMVVAFIGIAGAGGLSNTLFSNYARDKGWGMGALGRRNSQCHRRPDDQPVTHRMRIHSRGCQPGAVAGLDASYSSAISGSGSPRRFWEWPCPCMMSLEFIRNVPVTGDRVAAMTALKESPIATPAWAPSSGSRRSPAASWCWPRVRSACATRSPGAGPT